MHLSPSGRRSARAGAYTIAAVRASQAQMTWRGLTRIKCFDEPQMERFQKPRAILRPNPPIAYYVALGVRPLSEQAEEVPEFRRAKSLEWKRDPSRGR